MTDGRALRVGEPADFNGAIRAVRRRVGRLQYGATLSKEAVTLGSFGGRKLIAEPPQSVDRSEEI